MSDPKAEDIKTADPLDQWRELRDAYIDIWAKASVEVVNSEAYAQTNGALLETILSTSAPFREAQKKTMISALEQCNMPSREDIVRLADRLANLELLLDDMDAKLTQIHKAVTGAVAPQPAARPEAAVPKAAPEPTENARPAAKSAPRRTPAKASRKGA